jgi:hypothetical protein
VPFLLGISILWCLVTTTRSFAFSTDHRSHRNLSCYSQRQKLLSVHCKRKKSIYRDIVSIGVPRLSSSALSSTFSSRASASDTSTTSIVYQKVVRPSQNLPDILFLGYLVEYIESKFKIPDRLPMVYQTSFPPETENDDGTTSSRCRWIIAWDSPLSPSSDATRMEVEVLGIYTVDKSEKSGDSEAPSVPNMAMVVVKKQKDPAGGGIPPMMEQLFKDSEKRILKALDEGLDEFVAGKIQFDDEGSKKKRKAPSAIPNVQSVKEVLDAEIIEDDVNIDKVVLNNTEATEINEQPIKEIKNESTKILKEKIDAAKASMNIPKPEPEPTKPVTTPPRTEFALEAVKRKLREQKKQSAVTEDFAVAAAKQVLKKTQKKSRSEQPPKDRLKVPDTTSHVPSARQQTTTPEPIDLEKPFEPDDYMGKDRKFRATFSRTPGGSKSKGSISFRGKAPLNVDIPKTSREPSHSKKTPEEALDGTKTPLDKKRKLNMRFVDKESGNFPGESNDVQSQDSPKTTGTTKTQQEIEMDIMKAAAEVMESMANESEDMTPEELLRDVLKFDEEQTKNNEPGAGFVSGAFEKAKDLLKQQKQQQKEKILQTGVKEVTKDDLGFVDPDQKEELTPEEELKRIFQAGESFADRQITKYTAEELDLQDVDGEVDELLRKERDVSNYARVLDDELVELEVRINKSPNEELDGPRKNPIFDVFSGPDVYNPNVDPETINFPGALPGTKAVRLPKELKEATLQAQFALDVLKRMETVETVGKDGNVIKTEYFLGKKQLSQGQIDELRRVVVEASQVGLIDDPLTLMAEQSRLQILLDELWHQPEDRFQEIADNYRDLLLSENFVYIIKERLNQMAERDLDALRRDDNSLEEKHARERELLGWLVSFAQVLLKQARALGAELEAQQLEVIRSICKVAMDPRHQTEEETSVALSDAVRDMRPLLDDSFVAYLKYAVAEEEARLARMGVLDDPEHNQWLFVLKIVQQGVHAEIAKGINRYIDHIWYVLRMNTPKERKMLLEKLIDAMPSLDVRPFVHVIDSIAGALGDSRRGEFDGLTEMGEMTNKILQLYRDVHELLPPERIALKSQVADEWAEKQRKRLMEQRKVTTQRLEAARETEHLQGQIDEMVSRRGEIERMD